MAPLFRYRTSRCTLVNHTENHAVQCLTGTVMSSLLLRIPLAEHHRVSEISWTVTSHAACIPHLASKTIDSETDAVLRVLCHLEGDTLSEERMEVLMKELKSLLER